jgi:hypothetical protein
VRLGATLAHVSPGPQVPIAPWAARLLDAGFDSPGVPQVVGRGSLVPDPFVTLTSHCASWNTSPSVWRSPDRTRLTP